MLFTKIVDIIYYQNNANIVLPSFNMSRVLENPYVQHWFVQNVYKYFSIKYIFERKSVRIIDSKTLIPFNIPFDTFIVNPDYENLVVVLPSIAGTSDSVNVHDIISHLNGMNENKYNFVIYNRRGFDKNYPVPSSICPWHPYGFLDDLHQFMQYTNKHIPHKNIILFGISAGANLAIKYASAYPTSIRSVVCISNGFNLPRLIEYFKTNTTVDKHLTQSCKYIMKNTITDVAHPIYKCNTMKEFDSVINNIPTSEDIHKYYSENSSVDCLENLQVPALIINSIDDPLVPMDVCEEVMVKSKNNKNITLVITEKGGHLTFLTSTFSNWAYSLAKIYIDKVIAI